MDDQLFRTPGGTPVPAVSAEEMRSVDRVAVESFGIEVLQMMEHAGRALAETVRERADGPVTVLAGNGGNGGGGLCCARHLANRGAEVQVVLDRAPGDLSGPAAHHHATLDAMDCPVAVGPRTIDTSVVVDALVGYGLSGPLSGTAGELATAATEASGAVVSLDVPSGLDATTGERPGAAVDPDAVLTLALPKTGLVAVDTELLLADIGLPAGVYEALDIPTFGFEAYVVGLSAT